MNQERLNLYRIDMKYIRDLHNIDDIIINKANCLYQLCVGESNYKGKVRCLDRGRV